MRVAVLTDYQGAAVDFTVWSSLLEGAEAAFFYNAPSREGALIVRPASSARCAAPEVTEVRITRISGQDPRPRHADP